MPLIRCRELDSCRIQAWAIMVLLLATPAALGSWWAMVGTIVYFPIFVFRIRNEEEVLMRELPGYEEYCARVRCRIIPFIW